MITITYRNAVPLVVAPSLFKVSDIAGIPTLVCNAHAAIDCTACHAQGEARMALLRAERRDPRELADGCEDLRGVGHVTSLGHPNAVDRALAFRENASRPMLPRIPSILDAPTCSATIAPSGRRCRVSPTRQARWQLEALKAKGYRFEGVALPLCSSHLRAAIAKARAARIAEQRDGCREEP